MPPAGIEPAHAVQESGVQFAQKDAANEPGAAGGLPRLFAEMGVPRDEADARLRAAEKLVGEGRSTEADEQLQRALAFYRSVGATRYVREAEALLTAATAHDLAEERQRDR